MGYLDAASKAARAKRAADSARSWAKEESDRQLADAVSNLSQAVKELAEQMHRDS